MGNASFRVPKPANEPILDYRPGSPERAAVKAELAALRAGTLEIPVRIGSEEIATGDLAECRCPHDHAALLGRTHRMGPREVGRALEGALRARASWAAVPWEARASVFLKMADLLSGPWRARLNAATMLCQSKTIHQAEIDAAAELADFLRFNVWYMRQIYEEQPESAPGVWNRLEYRPLEGVVLAVTPFNFTSIAGNLPTAPALMGNVVLWKCASSTVYTARFLEDLFREAGLPEGVITLLQGDAAATTGPVLEHPDFAGLHFTGSTSTFRGIVRAVMQRLPAYRNFPRIVGETGGKDFLFVHGSADPAAVTAAVVRGGFEYQGQKCSAVSRVYAPRSLWRDLKDRLAAETGGIPMGDVADFSNFMGALIDRAAFDRVAHVVAKARADAAVRLVAGGDADDAEGFFVRPTILEVEDPNSPTMVEEIFGPVVSVFVYEDGRFEDALRLCDETSPFGLTGAVFARDRGAILAAERALVNAAGNFYINDKPTGAVVGQQPFGGARSSGTNDKAGSRFNLLRWISSRAIKETFVPPRDWRYPFMEET